MMILRLPDPLTERRFERLCQANPELRQESAAEQELIVMSPTASGTGIKKYSLQKINPYKLEFLQNFTCGLE